MDMASSTCNYYVDFDLVIIILRFLDGYNSKLTIILCTVIGNALSRNSKSGQVVARVNILASDG